MNRFGRAAAVLTLTATMTTGVALATGFGQGSARAAGGQGTDSPVVQTSTGSDSRSGSAANARRQPVVERGGDTSGVIDTRVLHRPGEQVDANWSTMYELMQYVVDDTAAVWNWYYQQWYGNGHFSSVHYNFLEPGASVATACGDTTDDNTAEYCPTDDTIYVSQARAAWYWNNAGGDFGVAAMLAHEYGHNVQAELQLSSPLSSRREQHADCLSGAFTHVAYNQGILDATDVAEGLASRRIVGDDGTGPDPHGSPEERAHAFQLGYDGTGPAVCDGILSGA